MSRPESGPMQFGDDWPGLFLRGDNAAPAGMLLSEVLSKVQRTGVLNALELAELHGLARDLGSADVRSGAPVQRLKSWEQCVWLGGLTPTRFEGPIVHPAKIQGPSPIIVEKRDEDSWAIVWDWTKEVFNREGKWEYERSPSNRSDAFKVRARWKWDEVEDAVRKAVVSLEGEWWLNEKDYDDQ